MQNKYQTNKNELKINLNSEKKIFVFDLHGVIFKLNLIQAIKEFLKCPYKIKLFSTIFSPKFCINSFKEFLNGSVAEEVVLNIENNFPNFKELVPTFFNAINAQKPINETVNLIKELKEEGHKIYIFSNIGEQSIEVLKQKYPEVFSLFDGILSTSKNDKYIKKPNPQAFQKFINHFDLQQSNLIFIDDKMKNVLAAQSNGIDSILFTTAFNLKRYFIDSNFI